MKLRFIVAIILFNFLFILPPQVKGWYPRLISESFVTGPLSVQIIGEDRSYILAPGDVLPDIARRFRVGYNSISRANPDVDPWDPGHWREILLPFRTILPAAAQPGITINLAEYRLYLIWNEGDKTRVRIYPVGIGQPGWATPEGLFEITMKIESPSWTSPPAFRANGQTPAIIPPGPDNPLGQHWLGLSAPGVGIHGTNKPHGIGRRVSHGCIRLYPADIEDLYRRVWEGIPVKITYQPIKVALDGKDLVVQAHPDFLGRIKTPLDKVVEVMNGLGWEGKIDRNALNKVIDEARGIPVTISEPF